MRKGAAKLKLNGPGNWAIAQSAASANASTATKARINLCLLYRVFSTIESFPFMSDEPWPNPKRAKDTRSAPGREGLTLLIGIPHHIPHTVKAD